VSRGGDDLSRVISDGGGWWMVQLEQLRRLCAFSRTEVRNGGAKGAALSPNVSASSLGGGKWVVREGEQ